MKTVKKRNCEPKPIRRRAYRLTLAFIVGFTSVFGLGVAQAVTYNSSNSYYGPVSGISYYNYASVSNTSRLYAGTFVGRNGSGNYPAGYAGANARLFRDNGTLCTETGFLYNDASAHGHGIATSGSCGSDGYYGYGVTRAWNGNGYNSYYTFKTRNVNY